VSSDALNDLKALEQRAEERLGRDHDSQEHEEGVAK